MILGSNKASECIKWSTFSVEVLKIWSLKWFPSASEKMAISCSIAKEIGELKHFYYQYMYYD
jgi:hypothetical protein